MYRRNRFGAEMFIRFGKKSMLLALAVVVALSCMIGGTLAWLVDSTEPLKNTFTYGDINIDLDESETDDGDDDSTTNTYPMLPGIDIDKDPKVTVKQGSKASWLFVKLEKSENFDDFLEFTIADGWTALEGEGNEGVYYRMVEEDNEADQVFPILKDDKVTVKSDVTKAMLNALDQEGGEGYPTLTITAYAVQRDADIAEISEVSNAWALALDNAGQNG